VNFITETPNHVFMILGVDEGQDPAGFYCVKCKHFWLGPKASLGTRAGTECPYASDPLLTVDLSPIAPQGRWARWFGRRR